MFSLEHEDKFTKLRAHFVATLPAREAEIEEQVSVLMENGPSRKAYELLFISVHKLAGISATYGLNSLGARAAEAEGQIDEARRVRPDEAQYYSILMAVDLVVEELQAAMAA